MTEQFSAEELNVLRNDLRETFMDSDGAAEIVRVFLMGRGYGVSPDAARHAASLVESSGCSLAILEKELGKIALAM